MMHAALIIVIKPTTRGYHKPKAFSLSCAIVVRFIASTSDIDSFVNRSRGDSLETEIIFKKMVLSSNSCVSMDCDFFHQVWTGL